MRHQLRAPDSYSIHRSLRVHMEMVGGPVVPVEVPIRTRRRGSVNR